MEEPVGSIRNSHRDTNPIKRKFAPKRFAEQARALVDGCSASGPIIRQRLDMERMKQPLQKGLFYVIENDGMAEPGFLVFLPGQAPIFLQTKMKAAPPCTLRMRVSPTLGEGGGSILIATLDTIQHTLRIEDVWMWKGVGVFDTMGYSKRRLYLKEFVERCWVPDARLMGGIQTTILNPKSVQESLNTPANSVNTFEFIPEMAGRRRMWIGDTFVRADKLANKPADKPADKPANKLADKLANKLAVKPADKPAENKTYTKALAKAIDKMPDIYELYDEEDRFIGQGSVQKFSLSQDLRSKSSTEGTLVNVQWRSEFNGYEIVGLLCDAPNTI
jgi:hypothetical protein